MKKKQLDFDQITTRGGDTGDSTLFNGERRRKDDPLFHLLGDLDELSSTLGVAKAGLRQFGPLPETEKRAFHWIGLFERIQADLIILGGMVANPDNRSRLKITPLTDKDTTYLEEAQREMMETTFFPREFIHPGKTLCSAWIDVSRTVCRRCERQIVGLIRNGVMTHLIPCQVYLNRLSDLLFVSARYWEQIKE
ncbi:cob(I)yrinic acid a,c-diamide adenosyltransferase [Oceanispirochaeta sp.]|jgi:cob(I)alamin adenosyltransferase|uniref:cob(I)yrinic acid a,c-diamide adenosyltransferase n=1 Tax=Oceanispirochaeta sp. TaxID=2035350 RepID=UPI002620E769|nr:cob(I)yrinic acid a,c-diamide adenosyltransferase [Oceanispirochaeta sp.]MDA3956438.1 cob(I)yrinic acid a,c-diamide adenosyltransferase [Oceanispirochaeta sp.]